MTKDNQESYKKRQKKTKDKNSQILNQNQVETTINKYKRQKKKKTNAEQLELIRLLPA